MPVLMQAPRRDLHELVKSLVSNDKGEPSTTSPVLFAPSAIAHVNGRIQICSLQNVPDLPPTQLPGSQLLDDAPSDATYVLIESDRSSDGGSSVQSVNANDLSTLRLHLDEGKRGQDQFLRIILPSTLAFIGNHLQEGKCVVIACNSGKDASVGVAVAAIQRYFDDDGHYSSSAQTGTS
jgi:tRNA A64-2'-O-ribosylphosphate transferase